MFDAMKQLKVFTALSGFDSQCMALDRHGIDYELVGWSEIDKYAIQAHNAIYPQWADRNFGDISKIDWNEVPDFDLFTYSFPCTDISSAGQQKGLEKGSGTRSSLLWECQKAIEIKRPKYCLMENVAALVSEKFRPFYIEWERLMCRYGYNNYSKVLNAKDYGIPQNRERIFMVSVLDPNKTFYWPEPMRLEKRLKDVLEQNVDEKYYLSDLSINRLKKNLGGRKLEADVNLSAKTILANCHKIQTLDNYIKDDEPKIIDDIYKNREPWVYGDYAPTIRSGHDMMKVAEPIHGISVHPTSHALEFKGEESIKKDASPALRATDYKCPHVVWENKPFYRVRKLTPRECFRLMGVTETNIDKIQNSGISNTQQYKMAGNSIVVDVLTHIFRKMFIETGQESEQLSLF